MRRCVPAFAGLSLAIAGSAAEVAVDVGHYATEPGVVSASGRSEFEYNRDLALALKNELERLRIQVRMIGERGDYAVLHHRTRDAAGADLFVSIHHDSVWPSMMPRANELSGFSLFISRDNRQVKKSLACASSIGKALRESGFKPSRYHADRALGGTRGFADETNGVHYFDHLAVARTASMPALLVEAGVIVNRAEDARMRDPQVRERIAVSIAAGIRACLAGENP